MDAAPAPAASEWYPGLGDVRALGAAELDSEDGTCEDGEDNDKVTEYEAEVLVEGDWRELTESSVLLSAALVLMENWPAEGISGPAEAPEGDKTREAN